MPFLVQCVGIYPDMLRLLRSGRCDRLVSLVMQLLLRFRVVRDDRLVRP